MAIVPSTSRHCMIQMYVQGGGCTPCLSPKMWPSDKDRGNMYTMSYVRDSGLPLRLVAMVKASKVPQQWGQRPN